MEHFGVGGAPDWARLALDRSDVLDVGGVVGLIARLAAEPGVEKLGELGLRGRPQADREGVGVIPPSRPVGGLRVDAEGRPNAVHLVRRYRRARPGPAADDRLIGAALGDVAGGA